MKLFQLMVEHTPDEENIDWTKIEPSVNFLKSPKGTCLTPILAWVWAARGGVGVGPVWLRAYGPFAFAPSGCGCGCGLGSWISSQC